MATIVGGIASSHTPTIGFALDTNKQNDPVWAPIFKGTNRCGNGWPTSSPTCCVYSAGTPGMHSGQSADRAEGRWGF